MSLVKSDIVYNVETTKNKFPRSLDFFWNGAVPVRAWLFLLGSFKGKNWIAGLTSAKDF